MKDDKKLKGIWKDKKRESKEYFTYEYSMNMQLLKAK